jgi:replicative DNA helicase Mcm
MSEELLHDVQRLLDTFGIASQVKQRANKSADEGVSYRLRVTGGSYEKYVEEIGFVSERKQERAEETMEEAGELHSNVNVIPDVADVIEETRKLLGMSQLDFSMPRTNIHGIEYEGKNPLRGTLQQIVEDMVERLHMLRSFDEVSESDLTWSVVDEYRQFVSLSQKEVAEEMGITQTGYGYHTRKNPDSGGQMVLEAYESIHRKVEEDLHQAHENLIRLESLAWGDIRWVKVDSVDEVAFDDEWMYDVQVEDVHNYVANGIMSHNSQLLRYASKLSPRGIQTSGKGSSAAGLCVGPSTEVAMNGESVEISEVVDEVVEDSVERPVGVEVSDLETVSADSSDGSVSSDVRYLWRMPEQESIDIKLDDGRGLVLSKNTPLVTGYDDNGNFSWTDASDLESGVEVATFVDDIDGMGEVSWSRVVSVSTTVSELYDMTTGVGNFYGNGIVVHNTAAAVRDSEFGGDDNWTLQAGALVLADQGLACVDEIDKMSDSDRSSMHEGLEQQTISVAKAGINATLKSRCTLLSAANPKDGRWNDFDPVPAQIDLEPALVSRFDMIFAPVDERTDERDTALADHILTTNLRGQQIEAGMDPDDDTNNVEPEIKPELFKKYVAYARQHCNPVLTDDARQYIEDFFVDIRAEGEAEGAIPVTARKIEGIIRITEAVARIRLSDEARLEHAERAVDIVMESLKDVGFDEDEGRFDVDMTETNQSSSQRKRRNTLIEVIGENEDEGEKGAPKELVVETMVEKYGFEEDVVEFDIAKMGREGKEIYEPQSGEFARM